MTQHLAVWNIEVQRPDGSGHRISQTVKRTHGEASALARFVFEPEYEVVKIERAT